MLLKESHISVFTLLYMCVAERLAVAWSKISHRSNGGSKIFVHDAMDLLMLVQCIYILGQYETVLLCSECDMVPDGADTSRCSTSRPRTLTTKQHCSWFDSLSFPHVSTPTFILLLCRCVVCRYN